MTHDNPAPGTAPLTDEQLGTIEAWSERLDRIARREVLRLLADARWHRAELAKYQRRFAGISAEWGKRLNLETMETLLNGGSRGAEAVAELVCAWDKEKKRADAVESDLTKARSKAERMRGALNGTLGLIRKAQERLCSYLVPDGNDDKDELVNALFYMFDGPEQRQIENVARAALATEAKEEMK